MHAALAKSSGVLPSPKSRLENEVAQTNTTRNNFA
jgi:hypothetical protein